MPSPNSQQMAWSPPGRRERKRLQNNAATGAVTSFSSIVWEMHHPCIRSHVGRVHHEGYWETIKAGNVDVPVWHEPQSRETA